MREEKKEGGAKKVVEWCNAGEGDGDEFNSAREGNGGSDRQARREQQGDERKDTQ